MRPALLTAAGVAKAYGAGAQRIVALTPTSLTIAAGEFVLITGPSGSGKSSLLAILCGLLRPGEGQVRLDGDDLYGLPTAALDALRLANFGFVFQGFHLIPALTAVEQVSLVLERQGFSRRQASGKAAETLAELGLERRLTSRPAELSGGEKQRVAIARALAKEPRIIFADEPTSALDSENGRQVAAALRGAIDRHGASVVCVTHDLRLMDQASRVLQIEDGAILATRAGLFAHG